MSIETRRKANRLGHAAEWRAVWRLRLAGYSILARRYKTRLGEIDIVARRGSLLIFVEVKARAKLDDAAYSVTERNQRRVAASASAWLAGHPDDAMCDMRFDAILVAPRSLPRHIQGAFEAE